MTLVVDFAVWPFDPDLLGATELHFSFYNFGGAGEKLNSGNGPDGRSGASIDGVHCRCLSLLVCFSENIVAHNSILV